jgi:hypothetical protein
MNRIVLSLLLGATLLSGVFAIRANADEWDKLTYITVHSPISIQGTVLLPGNYIMQLADSPSDRRIVQIFDARDSHIVATVLGNSAYRLRTPSKTLFTYYEQSPGSAAAIRDWYYPGDDFGIRFNPPRNVTNAGVAVNHPGTVSADVTGE